MSDPDYQRNKFLYLPASAAQRIAQSPVPPGGVDHERVESSVKFYPTDLQLQ